LQEFYTAADSEGFSDIAEAPEWWLTLCILHEHFKLIRDAMAAMQGKEYLLEMQKKKAKTAPEGHFRAPLHYGKT
jgi:hypothetical protein